MTPSYKQIDDFRKSLVGGYVFLTPELSSLSEEDQVNILNLIRHYNRFTKHNIYHNYGKFRYHQKTIMWKIDFIAKECDKKINKDIFIMMIMSLSDLSETIA